ncbi:Rrf2 family protein [Prosthecobacter vanneervenii]|uniref:Rrf2 family protein n=2 Tax=Prosthecobacter vanneervenii TaxID=48466 RepID=A0A7W7YCS0_9BACT|nr:Rrf2 family protein [Prosthecobacter vanneervenii]
MKLARREKLPLKFLEGILGDLRKAGMIERLRGKDCGARLSTSADAFTPGDVIRKIDGDFAPTYCTRKTTTQECNCPNREQCGVRMLMMKSHAATISILDGCSMSQVIDMVMLTMLNDSGRDVSNKAGKLRHANPEDGFLAALSRSKVMPSLLQTS